ncbi:MAG: hypothetical protein ACOYXC_16635 [Candidatus Rifleibacteriota bacterium]
MRTYLIVALTLFVALLTTSAFAFYGDGPLLEATIILDKKQTRESTDRELKITGVNSEGFIQGSEGNQKHYIQFKDIEQISFDLSTHAYTVKTWEGKTFKLKFGKLTTHNTSPTFDCMVLDESTGQPVEQMLDYTQIKSIVFKKPAATKTNTVKPEEKKTEAHESSQPVPEQTANPVSGEMGKEAIIAAWKKMAEIVDRNIELFNQFQSGRFTSIDEYELWAGKMEDFLKKDLQEIQNMLANARKHGENANDINNQWHKIVGNDDPFNGSRNVDALIMNLEDGLKYVTSGRRDAAESLLQESEAELNNIKDYAENIRPQIFQRNRRSLEVAKRFDPENQKVIKWLAQIDDLETASNAAAEKAMKEFVFPGHNQAFSGPGNPEKLAAAALEYFNSTCKSNEKAVKAVIFDKEWYCFQRNIFGQPTIWALTFVVAVQLDEDKDKGITRVWNISFLTEEKPGIEKAPPFRSAAFNQSYKMLTANLK